MNQQMEVDLTRYSRAGDEFHYRWAARRCLKLILPKSNLSRVIIEGSGPEHKMADGEYVIDVTEYTYIPESESEQVTYYQLKHSTKRQHQPFKLSDLRKTIEGFAKRYTDLFINKTIKGVDSVKFVILTNRVISKRFRAAVIALSRGDDAKPESVRILAKYTDLSGDDLKAFCAILELCDGEGDYIAQRYKLHAEIANLLAGSVEDAQIDSIVTLVRESALPDSNGVIVKEDILKCFRVTSSDELFPAEARFDALPNLIRREQHAELAEDILGHTAPIIIHAAGGVGKSVVSQQLITSLPEGSQGIAYDCFGSGTYLSRSKSRHKHCQALVQIINEIATLGLCQPLIPRATDQDDALMRSFINRLATAAETITQVNNKAILAIFIDAADNAEIAAEKYGESCFANQLLREEVPTGCRIIALCRTERIDRLQPISTVKLIELRPFSEDETAFHFRYFFPKATEYDCLELHRLTGGNGRVQINAMTTGKVTSVTEVLKHLGPGATVDEQIEAQLEAAVNAIKDNLLADDSLGIDMICKGLAILPPWVPLEVLAAVAQVKQETIKSFIADLGRSLWLTDNAVQFRDEPTEYWFQRKFAASTAQISSFVERLKPLASSFSYVAETLPELLHKAKQYDELINLALSDEYLPKHNPVDARSIRVYRLQFAFKAALKKKRHADAAKLALRAGEEVAGSDRQFTLFKDNVDLIAPLQSAEKVQELAYRRMIDGGWDGSENIYSASLLSSVDSCAGEARSYLKSAHLWLEMYFKERKKTKKFGHHATLTIEDKVELANAHLNLFGAQGVVDFMFKWTDKKTGFDIAQKITRRLIDVAKFDVVCEIANLAKQSQYIMLAIADELLTVGRFPPKDAMVQCLELFIDEQTRIPRPGYAGEANEELLAFISFAEGCLALKLNKRKVQLFCEHYVSTNVEPNIGSSYIDSERQCTLRSRVLIAALSKSDLTIEVLISVAFGDESKTNNRDMSDFRGVIGALLPWYILRVDILQGNCGSFKERFLQTKQHFGGAHNMMRREYNPATHIISQIKFDILALAKDLPAVDVEHWMEDLLSDQQNWQLNARLVALRCAYRSKHLSDFTESLEQSCIEQVELSNEDGPEIKADYYITLARALLAECVEDAAAYFNNAIEVVSKFGDELTERWRSIVSLAEQGKSSNQKSSKLAFRFIRCAELVGENVYKEKCWDRNGAIETCANLCPGTAIAVVSRWREREIGWLESDLPSLANALLTAKVISPAVLFSLSCFPWESDRGDFAVSCIDHSPALIRQTLLDLAVRQFRLQDASAKSFKELAHIAEKYGLENKELVDTLRFYDQQAEKQSNHIERKAPQSATEKRPNQLDGDVIFGGLVLTTSEGISQAFEKFDNLPPLSRGCSPRLIETFWKELYQRIPVSKAVQFLAALPDSKVVRIHDIEVAIAQLPPSWPNRARVNAVWPTFIDSIGRNYASSLISSHYRSSLLKVCSFYSDAEVVLCNAIYHGLAENNELITADAFWNFVDFATGSITSDEAIDLLDFALERFELHVDGDYADGVWSDWLIPPEDPLDALTGFIWSALGTPSSKERWQAAHCVRTLAATGCQAAIDSLINWMEKDTVDAFGSKKYPFYNLHARQYLLIALARVALDKPELLKTHSLLFEDYALHNIQHILIQKFASEIALAIETFYPGTYQPDSVQNLEQVGVSKFPVKHIETYYESRQTPWHEAGQVDKTIEFSFGHDFSSDWFEPLGYVFGITVEQVKELAREVIIKDWQVKADNGGIDEPRSALRCFDSRYGEMETYYQNRQYPKTDDFEFYLSYHGMLSVAAKLLTVMPVVDGYFDDDKWDDWIQQHTLTRQDGYWLADRRDAASLLRAPWMDQEKSDDWRWMIKASDFLDTLLFDFDGETGINLWGKWNETDGEREQQYTINSALVSPDSAQSLLFALQTCQEPQDFRIPAYSEEASEINVSPFSLKGWIVDNRWEPRLDEFDTDAAGISSPPLEIGADVTSVLGLHADSEKRYWYADIRGASVVKSEIWSSHDPSDVDRPNRYGRRIGGTLVMLKQLCSTLSCEIIFKVQLKRNYCREIYSRDKNVGRYPPNHKIYILSADGKLRDHRGSYQIR